MVTPSAPATPVLRARQLRKSMTRHEIRLWLGLRALRAQGLHFRRQSPLKGYVLDFVCYKHRLIVECDGSQHAQGPQAARDRHRDGLFAADGFLTLRFWNHEIDDHFHGVVDTIIARALENLTS